MRVFKMGIAQVERKAPKSVALQGRQAGFTIVETLIVLAVTGILFLSAIMTVSGRQGRTEFNQSINDIQNVLNQTINEVGAGNYPDPGSFGCQSGPGGTITFSGTGSPQGTSKDCIFLGKVVHFYNLQDDKNQPFYTYTLAGARESTDGNVTTSIVGAKPKIASNNIDNSTLKFGLTISSIKADGTNIGSFALVNSLGSYNGANLASGSLQVNLLPIKGNSQLSKNDSDEKAAIEQYLYGLPPTTTDASIVNPDSGVQICFNSGTTGQSGMVTIGGGNDRVLGTSIRIFSNKDCV